MKIQIAATPLGKGPRLFHTTVHGHGDMHGRMMTVASTSLARALYLAWVEVHGDAVPLDLTLCDGYLIGEVME